MTSFPYKTQPLAEYQRTILRDTALREFHFLALEQGTGKTWLTLNTAAALWLNNCIDGMIVLAPNGVHAAWAHDQLPTHMPEVVPCLVSVWSSARERRHVLRNTYSPETLTVLDDLSGRRLALRVLCVNTEATGSVVALDRAITRMLKSGRMLLVVDESSDYAAPNAKRTRALQRWSRLAAYRRCLDGTPIGKAPWDLWSVYRFLSPRIFAYAPTYAAMKAMHGEWYEIQRSGGSQGTRAVKLLKKKPDGTPWYKNLDLLTSAMAPHTSRVTKAAALPFLPPKIYDKVYFELSPAQVRAIATLRKELQVRLESGAMVTAANVLTQYLRIQQLASGFVATDPVWGGGGGGDADAAVAVAAEPLTYLFPTPRDNPRLVALEGCVARHNPRTYPTLIWARFRADIQLIAALMREHGYATAVYDGSTPSAEREAIVRDFQQGAYDIIVGNTAAGGRGLNLFRTEHVIYYSNSFGLRRRLQSEDRAHRIGTKRAVRYSDIIGLDDVVAPRFSIDNIIVRALRQNKDLADLVTGDPMLTAWL